MGWIHSNLMKFKVSGYDLKSLDKGTFVSKAILFSYDLQPIYSHYILTEIATVFSIGPNFQQLFSKVPSFKILCLMICESWLELPNFNSMAPNSDSIIMNELNLLSLYITDSSALLLRFLPFPHYMSHFLKKISIFPFYFSVTTFIIELRYEKVYILE